MKNIVVSLLAVLFGLAAGAALMAVTGHSPIEGYKYLFDGGLKNIERFGNTLATATPLCFTVLSVGGLCATAVGLTLDLPRPLLLFVMVIAGFIGGALWAYIPGLLKAKFNVHEVVSTIMMNWISYWTVYYMVPAYFKGEFLETESRKLPDHASLRDPLFTEGFNG